MALSPNKADQKLSRTALIALVIGSMVGSGIFALPASFGRATGALGAVIAWIIAGGGMLMLALVFQTLSRRKPDLDAGIYAYAKDGFGEYFGFASAAGYWIGCCLADVACLILIKATIGQFFPVFGDGTTPTAIAAASVLLWGVHFLVLRGIKSAAALNTIATYTKIIPILVFIVVAIVAMDPHLFSQNFWGTEQPGVGAVAVQVRSTMLLTVFVFVGIEGASVYSRYARDRSDIGIATVVGFLAVLSLLVLVTLLSYGVLPRQELAGLATPSMAGVMESMVGRWGAIFISVALLISILGNYLSWSLLAAEVLHSAAVNHCSSFSPSANGRRRSSRRSKAPCLQRSRSPHAPASMDWRPERSRSEVLLLSLVGHLEARMNIPTVGGALILGGLVAMIAPTTVSLAQSNDKGVSAPKDTGASTPNSSTPNTNTNPTKHRYWRHRGGTHPHYGSRRVRT